MNNQQELIFRQLLTLRDGARVLLRPLVPEDKQALLNLFSTVTSEERRSMRTDVRNPSLVEGWVDSIDYNTVLPLVAVVGERIVGDATLRFGHGPARHRAEVRIFLAKDFRTRGLGNRMLQALIEIAKKRDLLILEAEILQDQPSFIKAFQTQGFQTEAMLQDYFMAPDGEMCAVVKMILRLRTPNDEF
ncbi:MAG: GNAT family N-acetyltransferase [Anaerolineales bacterium]